MEFLMNILGLLLYLVIHLGGGFLVTGMFALAFYFIYELVWKKTLGKLNLFKAKNEEGEIFNACFSCAIIVVISWLVADGSFENIITEIQSIFA